MQITLPAIPAAPLVSGHPFGVPGVPPRGPDPRRVEATPAPSSADNAPDRRLATASPREELQAALASPADHIAPPTIMQLRIAAMLESPEAGLDTGATTPPENGARVAFSYAAAAAGPAANAPREDGANAPGP
ncbi:hypothetical protein ROJ8625_02143 [Roseivivax jejudonensis]|uniref:Uncharacterized protein n=1 Tax=Roseivivax jejudonensis TaxID=1529041 RepID=A0A1X6Z809_9RHOB|nr:hypothetical protein [Roseivivax jejudonensis]SLN43296.1 hypothetical protein ROJ8625_02143 [Roseivivax jejudonensis]